MIKMIVVKNGKLKQKINIKFIFSFENYLKETHSTTTGQGTHMQIHTYATDEKNFLLDLVTIITKVIYMT